MPRVFRIGDTEVEISYGVVHRGRIVRRVSSHLMQKAQEVIEQAFWMLKEHRRKYHVCSFQLRKIQGHWISRLGPPERKPAPWLKLEIPIWSGEDIVDPTTDHRPFTVTVDVIADWELLKLRKVLMQESVPGPKTQLAGPQLLIELANAMFTRFDPEHELAVAINAVAGTIRTKDVRAVL